MKTLTLILAMLIALASSTYAQLIPNKDVRFMYSISVGKNTTADSSTLIDIGLEGTNKGILLPRVNDTSSVLAPKRGLFVYSLATQELFIHNGTKWIAVNSASLCLKYADTFNIFNKFLRYSDSAQMLQPYIRKDTVLLLLSTKVNVSDTGVMLQPYLRAVDTTAMLANYLRSNTKFIDSAAIFGDSLRFYQRGTRIAAVLLPAVTGGGGGGATYFAGNGILFSGSFIKADTAVVASLNALKDSIAVVRALILPSSVVAPASLAGLKTTTGVTGKTAIRQGYDTPGDGGLAQYYWDATSVEAEDSARIVKNPTQDTGRWKLNITTDRVSAAIFGLKGDSSAINSQFNLDKFFDAAIAMNKIAYFPNGTWVLPENFVYNPGYSTLRVEGQSKEGTIITSRFGSVKYLIPEKVDLTQKKSNYPDGYYRVDKIGVIDSTWGTTIMTTAALDDYLLLSSGTPTITTLAAVKAAGYITELDINASDPAIDGKYLVSRMDFATTGGGYLHTSLPYNTAVKILIGTYLQRSGSVWSRPNPSDGFTPGGNFSLKNLQFRDCGFYLFTPNNKTAGKEDFDYLTLDNVIAKHVLRVCGLDRQSTSSTFPGVQGYRKGSNYHFSDGFSFNYKNINILDCDFSYIGTSVFWEYPPTRNLTIRRTNYHDMPTVNELSIYLPMSSYVSADPDDDLGYSQKTKSILTDILVKDVRTLSPVSNAGSHIFRTNGNATYDNIQILDCNYTNFYLGGTNNHLNNITVRPYYDSYAWRTISAGSVAIPEVFHIKGGDLSSDEGTSITNARIEKASNVYPVDLKADQNTPVKLDNVKLMSASWVSDLLPTDTSINREFMYIVRDTAKFHALATAGKYDTAVHVGDKTYWDIRNYKWMKAGTVTSAPAINKDYSYTYEKTFTITNSTIYAGTLLEINDGQFNELKVDHSDIYVWRGLFTNTNDSLINFSISNSNLYKGTGGAPTLHSQWINNATYTNNKWYYNQVSSWTLGVSTRLDFDNNKILPWPKYIGGTNNTALSGPGGGSETAIKFVSLQNAEISMTGGFIDSYLARSAPIGFSGIGKASFDGVGFNSRLVSPQTNLSTKRGLFYFAAGSSLPILNANNLNVDYDAVANKAVLIVNIPDGSPAVTLGTLNLGKIRSTGTNRLTALYTQNVASNSDSMLITNLNVDNIYEAPTDFFSNPLIANKNVSNQQTVTLSANGSIVLNQGWIIDRIDMISTGAVTDLKVGTSSGASDLAMMDLITGENSLGINFRAPTSTTSTTIFFSNLTGAGATVTFILNRK